MEKTVEQQSAAASEQRTLKDYAVLVGKGICMGSADVVPGVSGGTMAFILGIYEELINSIRVVGRPEFLKAVFGFNLKQVFEILNWKFLLAIGTGIILAVLSLAQILEHLLENQPVYLWSFFFGLVVASVWVVNGRVEKWSAGTVGMLVAGTIGAFFLVGLVPAETTNAWWFLILSGSIAICAMILPGISGSFILVLLGKYEFVLGAVNDRDIVSIGFIGIGAVIGIVSFAQVLGWLFKNYHDLTVAALIGLMIGSLRKIWPWKDEIPSTFGGREVLLEENVLPTAAANGLEEIGMALLLAVVGFGVVILLERFAGGHSD